MADAQYGEGRQFNLHSAGTDLVEGSALAVKSSSGAIAVDGKTVGSVNALYVAITDGSGTQITSFGGGTQYVGDAAATSTPTGTISMGLANSAAPTNVSANNDAVALWALQNGSLNVVLRDTSGAAVSVGGGTQYVGDAAATATPTGTILMGLANTSAPTDVSSANDAVAAWLSPKGALNVSLRDTAGAAVLTGAQYIEDAALGAVGSGQGTLLVGRASTAAPTAVSSDADAVGLWASRQGVLATMLSSGTGTLVGVSAETTANVLAVGGGVAHDSVDNGNPIKIGGKANSGTPTAVQDADRVNAWFGTLGHVMVGLLSGSGSAGSDAVSLGSLLAPGGIVANGAHFGVGTFSFNGSSWDRVRTEAGTTGFLGVGGSVAHDGVDNGNPIKIGGYAKASAPTAVSNDGDRVNAWFSRTGQMAAFLGNGVQSGQDAFSNSSLSYNRSPDDFATLLAVAPSIFGGTTWDRPRSVEALSGAPNIDTGVPAVGDGPGFDRKTNPTGVAATSTANAVTVVVNGADVIAFHVTTIGTTPGSMIFETTGDDGAWATAGMVVKLATGPDTRIEGAFVPAVNDVYLVRVTGHRQVRYRVNAVYVSGTATVKVTSALGVGMIKSMDMGAPPHNFGYAPASATAQYTTTQTSTTLGPTVASTQRMVVTSIQMQVGGTTAGTLQVYFGTGAYSRGTSKAIFDGEFAPSATLKPGYALAPSVPWVGAADEELKVTGSAAINPLTVTVWYYLVAA